MVRKKRPGRARRKRKKTKGSSKLILILLLILPAVLVFQGYRWISGEMADKAHLFMERVTASDRAGAARFLAEENLDLSELFSLFEEPEVEYVGIGTVWLSGLSGGWAEIKFSSAGSMLTAPLYLTRSGREWRVFKIPEVKTITGAFVRGEQDGLLKLYWGKEEKNLRAERSFGLVFGQAVNVRQVEDVAVLVKQLDELALSRLVRRSSTEIEGEREGVLPARKALPVYRVNMEQNLAEKSVGPGSPGDLNIGRENLIFYLYKGEIVAAKVEGPYNPRTIRVVLRQNLANLNQDGLQHSRLSLSGKTALYLEDKIGGVRHHFEAGLPVLIEPDGEKIRVIPAGGRPLVFSNRIWFSAGEGRISISNLQRSGWVGAPAYRGSLDIIAQGGRLLLVNELTLEQYLYTVVPSEMPLSFGREPLKAQAVAARTYAFKNIFSGRYSGYGAHVDDSVLSQVYNNNPEYPASNAAVDDTAGLVLFYNDTVADARFFSTSAGHTAAYHEVWSEPATGRFPSEPVTYLQAASQIPGEEIALKTEAQVQSFLERSDWPAYDAEAPFFRWQVEMSAAELAASVNYNLGSRFREQPDFILTRDGDRFHSVEISHNPLGELLEIRVIQRGTGGNVMVLELEGTNGSYRILKEYNIRFTLRPMQYLEGAPAVALERNDGSLLHNHSILPSAFIFFDLHRDEDGRLKKVIIRGGGNGHGVGMSQHGARGMFLRGYDFSAILKHFYPGTEIRNIASLHQIDAGEKARQDEADGIAISAK